MLNIGFKWVRIQQNKVNISRINSSCGGVIGAAIGCYFVAIDCAS